MPFRLNAKNVFLTYPRCSIAPRTLGEHLKTLRPTTFIQVSRETHEDGAYHLHVLLQWVDKYNLRNERFFDFEDHHPNIQAVRQVADVFDYINKALPTPCTENDKWTSGEVSLNPKADKWLRVANATSESECLEAALDASPRDFVLNHDKITEYARKKARHIEPYVHDEGITFHLPPQLLAYITNEFVNPVGLCPWILYDNHVLNVDQNESIVLKRCCFRGRPGLARQRGRAPLEHTFTGGECLTYRHSPQTQSTLSWTTYRSDSCRTKSSGGGRR